MRYKLIIILALAVVVPLIGSGYILIYSAEKAMNSEKESKLYGIARTLDASMEGDFESLLSIEAKSASHDEKVRLLNQRLSGVTEKIVSGNPGVGAGIILKISIVLLHMDQVLNMAQRLENQ